jgi:large subunit ribosomal protein L24
MNQRLKIRKGDVVTVISGKDKGKSGKVLSVLTASSKVLVEKINFVKRHTKPSQKMPQGGIHEKEAPLSISKVMVLDTHSGKPSRIGRKKLADGKLVRFFKKSGEMIELTKA